MENFISKLLWSRYLPLLTMECEGLPYLGEWGPGRYRIHPRQCFATQSQFYTTVFLRRGGLCLFWFLIPLVISFIPSDSLTTPFLLFFFWSLHWHTIYSSAFSILPGKLRTKYTQCSFKYSRHSGRGCFLHGKKSEEEREGRVQWLSEMSFLNLVHENFSSSPEPLHAQQGSTLSQLFFETLLSVPLWVGDIFLGCLSWPIYSTHLRNMPALTLQSLSEIQNTSRKEYETNKNK